MALLGVPVSLARDTGDADIVLTLKNYYKKKPPGAARRRGRGPAGLCAEEQHGQPDATDPGEHFELPPTGWPAGGAGAAGAPKARTTP